MACPVKSGVAQKPVHTLARTRRDPSAPSSRKADFSVYPVNRGEYTETRERQDRHSNIYKSSQSPYQPRTRSNPLATSQPNGSNPTMLAPPQRAPPLSSPPYRTHIH